MGEALKTARQALSLAKTTEGHSALTHIFPQWLVKLEGHSIAVSHAAFSPDGQRIVTAGGQDNTARVWNLANGQLLAKLEGHSDSVTRAAFSPAAARQLEVVWTLRGDRYRGRVLTFSH